MVNYLCFKTANEVIVMKRVNYVEKLIGKFLIVAVVCGAFSPPMAHADGEWIGASGGDWENPDNWRDGVVAASGAAYITNAIAANPNILVNGLYALDSILLYPPAGRVFNIDATYPAGSLDQYSFTPTGDAFSATVAANGSRVEWNVPITGNKPIEIYWGGGFFLRCPWTGTGAITRQGGTLEVDHRFTMATQDGTVSSNLIASRTLNLDGGANLILGGRFPKREGAGYFILTPGSPIAELAPTNFSNRGIAAAGQLVTAAGLPDGTRVARTFSSNSGKIALSRLPLDTLTEVTTQLLTFAAAPCWDVVQDFDLLTVNNSQCTVTLYPFIYGAGNNQESSGTNTVTLNVGKITGNADLLTTLNGSYHGTDGTLAVDDLTSFKKTLILQSIAHLALKKLPDEATTPPAANPALWMDASAAGTVTTDGNGRVTSWADVRGASYAEATPWLESPTVMPDELNGRPVIDFGTAGSRQALQWNREITGIKAVFVVLGSQETGGCLLGAKPGCTTSYQRGFNPIDAVANNTANAATYRLHKANGLVPINPTGTYRVAINGSPVELGGSGMSGGYDVYTVSLPSLSYKASAFAFDAGNDADGGRLSGGQRLAEVLVYTNTLTAAQCVEVENYLRKKWMDVDVEGRGCARVNNLTVKGAPFIESRDGSPLRIEKMTGTGNLTVETNNIVSVNLLGSGASFTLREGATLRVNARQVPGAPALDDTLLWLDAADTDSFTLDGNGDVLEWKNRAPNGIESVTVGPGSGSVTPTRPKRIQDANGRWLVDFGSIGNGCALRCASNLWSRSVFMVWIQKDYGCQPFGNMKDNYTTTTPGFKGNTFRQTTFSRHNGTTMGSGIVTSWSGTNERNGSWYRNGLLIENVTLVPMPTNQLILNSGVMQGGDRISAIGGFDYDDKNTGNWLCSGGFQLAEMILYGTTLDDTARRDVEAYLQRKWFGTIPAGYADGALGVASITVQGNATVEDTGNVPLAVERVKGSGTLTLAGDRPMVYGSKEDGVTVIGQRGGVCAFPTEELAAGENPILHIDATVRSAVTFYQSTYAQYYTDLAQGIKIGSAYGATSWVPIYGTNPGTNCNGKAVIDFGHHGYNYREYRGYKWDPEMTNIRTVFWMFRDHPERGGGYLLGHTSGEDFRRGNYGTLLNASPLFDSGASESVKNGSIHVNGFSVPYNHVPDPEWQVLSVVTTNNTTANQISADRTTANQANWGGLQVGELLIYSRPMDDYERTRTEAYLMEKWLGKKHHEWYQVNNGWFVHGGQTITNALGATDAYLAGLQGNGEVLFQGAKVAVLGDGHAFGGTARLAGNSVVTLGAASYASSTWIVEAGSVLDLGGKTVTLGGIGGGGTVSNGTLVVSELIVGAADARADLTVKGNLKLAANARVSVLSPERYASGVTVQGKFAMVDGEISVRLVSAVPFAQHAILTFAELDAGTVLDQWPCVSNLPSQSGYTLRVRASEGVYTLGGSSAGTIIVIR